MSTLCEHEINVTGILSALKRSVLFHFNSMEHSQPFFPEYINLLPFFKNGDDTVMIVLRHKNPCMNKHFVAINYITCAPHYRERFEELFATRAKAIDTMPGFIDMHVLRPQQEEDAYLIVSYWENESAFKEWTKSEAFIEGHKRGFADIAAAKAANQPAPMNSDFKTYKIIAN